MTMRKPREWTAEQIERAASGYLLAKLGDRLWAGEPVYDEKKRQWRVSIHSAALPEEEVLGHLLLDVRGNVLRAPSRYELACPPEQRPVPSFSLPSNLAFAFPRGKGEPDQEPLVLPDLPDDPTAIGQEILADPALKAAYAALKAALADPQMRPTVLNALAAFAQAARPEEKPNGESQ